MQIFIVKFLQNKTKPIRFNGPFLSNSKDFWHILIVLWVCKIIIIIIIIWSQLKISKKFDFNSRKLSKIFLLVSFWCQKQQLQSRKICECLRSGKYVSIFSLSLVSAMISICVLRLRGGVRETAGFITFELSSSSSSGLTHPPTELLPIAGNERGRGGSQETDAHI